MSLLSARMFKTSCQMRRHHMNGDLENLFSVSNHHFGAKVYYHPISTKDQATLHQFGKKVLSGFFMGYSLYAGGSWKGGILVAYVEELQENDASEVYLRRINIIEVLVPKDNKEHFKFACVNGALTLAGKVPAVRTSDEIRQDTEKGEEHRSDLHGETDEPDSAKQRQEQYDLEAEHDFLSISGSFVYLHCSRETTVKSASGRIGSHSTQVH